jgi:hypothetical protein
MLARVPGRANLRRWVAYALIGVAASALLGWPWYFAFASAAVAALLLGPELVASARIAVTRARRTFGDDIALPAMIAPLVLLGLSGLVGQSSRLPVRALLVVGALLLVLAIAAFLWTSLPSQAWVVFSATAIVSVGLVVIQVVEHGRDPTQLGWLTFLVQLSLITWYAGISLWLVERLIATAGEGASIKRIAALVGICVVLTALIPGVLFFWAIPHFFHPAFGWWIGFFLLFSVAATFAVIPPWIAVLVGGALLFAQFTKHSPYLRSAGWFVICLVALAVGLVARRWIRHKPTAARVMAPTTASDTDQVVERSTARGTRDAVAQWARAFLVIAGGFAIAAAGTAAVVYTPVGKDDIEQNDPGRWLAQSVAQLQETFAPNLYLERTDHPPSAVCAYVLGPAPAANRDSPTSRDCLATNEHSAPRSTEGPDPTLKPRTYAVAIRNVGEALSHRFCGGRPSRRCPSVEHTALVIEYWLFYDDDVWKSHTAVGSVVQRHEADWEVIVTGFGVRPSGHQAEAYKPLWTAFSEHCGGSWLPWSAVRRDGTHPIAWVARGSHANYPSGRERSPNWASCVKISWLDRLVDVFSFSASIVEKLPETSAPLRTPLVVRDRESRPYLRDLKPLGRGETIELVGWHTAARERTSKAANPGAPPDKKRYGIESPLDPARRMGHDPIGAIFGESTFYRCNALQRVCARQE